MIMLNQTNQAMDIVADILADEQENTISSYQYNGVELTSINTKTSSLNEASDGVTPVRLERTTNSLKGYCSTN